jgi:hypothetical protein
MYIAEPKCSEIRHETEYTVLHLRHVPELTPHRHKCKAKTVPLHVIKVYSGRDFASLFLNLSIKGSVWSASRTGDFIPDESALSNRRLCSRKEKNIFPRRDTIPDRPARSLVVPTTLSRLLKQECIGSILQTTNLWAQFSLCHVNPREILSD